MSVNYYARTSNTPANEEGLHIGKYTNGLDFLFRAHPDQNLTTCEAWHAYLSQPGVQVVAEHGAAEDFDTFWADAVKRPADVGGKHVMRSHRDEWRGQGRSWFTDKQWTDKHGHPFAAYEFC